MMQKLLGHATITAEEALMNPDPQALAICQQATLQNVLSGRCRCTICGRQATVAMCWIPSFAILNKLHTPFGQSRVMGYGVCAMCEQSLAASQDNSLFDLISQRLIQYLWDCDAILTPRERMPSIFLN